MSPSVCQSVCEILLLWAAYAAKKGLRSFWWDRENPIFKKKGGETVKSMPKLCIFQYFISSHLSSKHSYFSDDNKSSFQIQSINCCGEELHISIMILCAILILLQHSYLLLSKISEYLANMDYTRIHLTIQIVHDCILYRNTHDYKRTSWGWAVPNSAILS